MSTPGVMAASFAAEWNTSGPSHLIDATMSMPCHIRCDGSISAPTFVAPTRSTSFLRVTGENTRLCGCISMAIRVLLARARPSISLQNFAATSHW
jgi:hypothetical protein